MDDYNLDAIKSTSRKSVVLASVTNLVMAALGIIFINLYEFEVLKNMNHAYSLPSYILLNLILTITIIASLYCSNMTCSYKNVSYLWGFMGIVYLIFGFAFLAQYLFDLPVVYDPDHKYVYSRSEAGIEDRSHGVVEPFKPYWGLFQKPDIIAALQSFDETIVKTIRNVTPPLFNTSAAYYVQLRPLILVPPLLTKISYCFFMGLMGLLLKLLCRRVTSSQNKNKNLIRGVASEGTRKNNVESMVEETFGDEVNRTRRTRIWLTTVRTFTRMLGVTSLIIVGTLTVMDHQQTEIMVYHLHDESCAGTFVPAEESPTILPVHVFGLIGPIETTTTTSTTTTRDGILINYAAAKCYSNDVSYIKSHDTSARWIREDVVRAPPGTRIFESTNEKLTIPNHYTIVSPYILSGFPIIWEVILTTRILSLIGFFMLSMKKLQSNLFSNIFLLLVIIGNFICVLFSHPNLVGSIVGDIFKDIARVEVSKTTLGFPHVLSDLYEAEYQVKLLSHSPYVDMMVMPERKLETNDATGSQSMFAQYSARRFESMYYCLEETTRSLLRYLVDNPDFNVTVEAIDNKETPDFDKILAYCSDSVMSGPWRAMFGVTALTIFGVPLFLSTMGLIMNVYCASMFKKLLVREHKLQSIALSRSPTASTHTKDMGLVAKDIQTENMISITHMEPVLTPSNGTYQKNQINRPVVRGYTPSLTPRSKRAFLLLNGNN